MKRFHLAIAVAAGVVLLALVVGWQLAGGAPPDVPPAWQKTVLLPEPDASQRGHATVGIVIGSGGDLAQEHVSNQPGALDGIVPPGDRRKLFQALNGRCGVVARDRCWSSVNIWSREPEYLWVFEDQQAVPEIRVVGQAEGTIPAGEPGTAGALEYRLQAEHLKTVKDRSETQPSVPVSLKVGDEVDTDPDEQKKWCQIRYTLTLRNRSDSSAEPKTVSWDRWHKVRACPPNLVGEKVTPLAAPMTPDQYEPGDGMEFCSAPVSWLLADHRQTAHVVIKDYHLFPEKAWNGFVAAMDQRVFIAFEDQVEKVPADDGDGSAAGEWRFVNGSEPEVKLVGATQGICDTKTLGCPESRQLRYRMRVRWMGESNRASKKTGWAFLQLDHVYFPENVPPHVVSKGVGLQAEVGPGRATLLPERFGEDPEE
ncbi:MAG: hypothetical protein ACLFVU_11265 [Phycisphaerae bacterium]